MKSREAHVALGASALCTVAACAQVVSLCSNSWVVAQLSRRHGNGTADERSRGTVSIGLFRGVQELDDGYGATPRDLDMIGIIRQDVGFAFYGMWISTIFFLTAALLFSIISALFALAYALHRPLRSFKSILGLYIWNCASVGGGTTGSVVASRLSEDPHVSVLLIEAGTDGTLLFDLPVGMISTLGSSEDWKFKSVPENTSCLGMYDNECMHNRGKVLGGSSTLNALIFVRGSPKDYDNWEAMGNPGWSYKDVLPYFKKLENVLIPEFQGDRRYRGKGGPLSVSFPNYRSKDLVEAWLAAGQELGYPVVDYNSRTPYGFGATQVTYRFGRRMNAAKAYLKPARFRPNLKVVLSSVVSKILFSGDQAAAVEFYRHGRKYVALPRREIIVCAGAFGSPQILMLSGIGPEDELRKHEIPVVTDLPVGRNMESHVAVGGITFSLNSSLSLLLLPSITNPALLLQYIFTGKGILSACPIEGLAFLNTPYNTDKDWPDVELEFSTFNFIGNEGGEVIPRVLNLRKEIMEVYRPLFHKHSVHVTLYVNRPKSRGYVTLRSSDPFSPPVIKRNWFTHPDDMRRTLEGIRTIFKVMKTEAFRKLGTRFFPSVLPGCKHLEPFSYEYWECHVRTFSWTRWHETGTCRMGVRDNNSVVDARLRVHGIRGLRVADASVFPQMISGNPQAACYMVGEKAADLIKEDWGDLG